MNEPLCIDLEFLRAEKVADPYGMRFGSERYMLRQERGRYGEIILDWQELLGMLAELQKPRGGVERAQRVGERLRELLRPAGWEQYEIEIGKAVREGRAAKITFLSTASELYALPWEITTIAPTGEQLCQLRNCSIAYEWPGAPRVDVSPDTPPKGRVLLVWAGAVPAADHVRELTQALISAGESVDALQQVSQVSRQRLHTTLTEAAEAGKPYSVLHILCHGVVRDDIVYLVWRDEEGEDDYVDPSQLRAIVSPFASSLKLVVLSACNAGQAGALGSRLGSVGLALHRGMMESGGIASVIASRFPLSISGSTTMTRAFYGTVWKEGVRRAVVAARDALNPALSTESEYRIDYASLLHFALPYEATLAPPDAMAGTQAPGRTVSALRRHERLSNERYELLQCMDQNGNTTIWLAFDYESRMLVVLEMLSDAWARDEGVREQFLRATANAFEKPHPRIASVLEKAHTDEGIVYAVIEYVPGGNLAETVLNGLLTTDEALAALVPLGVAAQHTRETGQSHKAITPMRIVFDAKGQTKLLGGYVPKAPDENISAVGQATFIYDAPETLGGSRTSDARSDVYSLGMTCIFVAHGKRLPVNVMMDPHGMINGLSCSESLKTVLRRAVEADAQKRWPTAIDFCRELDNALQDTSASVPVDVFVGREKQLGQLDTWLASVMAGKTQIGLIVGDPGCGKTALLRAFSHRAISLAPNIIFAATHCDAHIGAGDAYAPFIDLFTQLTGGVDMSRTQGILQSEHARRLRRLMPDALEALTNAAPDLIGPFLSAPSLSGRVAGLVENGTTWGESLKRRLTEVGANAEVDPAQLFRQCLDFLTNLAQERVIVLILEDLHWADNASINLLLHLATKIKGRKVFILGSFRTNEVTLEREGERHPIVTMRNEVKSTFDNVEVNLEALGIEERRAFVSALIDSEPNLLDTEFREALLSHTGGHALFSIELLRMLQGRHAVAKDADGRWVKGQNLDWSDLPPKVEGVIEERIARLETEMRDLLEVASVEGRDFTVQVLGRIQNVGERNILNSLRRDLESRHHLITAGATTKLGRVVVSHYSFANGLFQKYFYENMPEAMRISLHGEIAGILEELYQERTESIAVQLAHHHEFAGNSEKAIEYLLVAGKRALRMSAYGEARQSFRRALSLLQTIPEAQERDGIEAELCVRLATVEKTTHGWASKEAKSLYDRALELFGHLETHPLRSSALLGMWAFYLVRGELQLSLTTAEQLLPLAEKTNDQGIQLAARLAIANSSFWLGELTVARQQAEALDALYNANASQEYRIHYGQDPMVTVTMVRTWTMWLTGFPTTALRIAQEAVALAERLDHPFSLAIALTTLGWLFHHLRDIEATRQTAERLMQLSRERNFPSYVGLGVMLAGWAKSQAGNDSEGQADITDGFAAWSATSGQLTITFMSVLLAEAHLHAKRMDDALQVIERGLDAATKNHERPYVPELWRLRGECLLAKGLPDEGANALRQAIQEAKKLGTVMLEVRGGMSLARAATSAEQRAEAREGLMQASASITEGLDNAEIASAKRMINELSP